MRSRKKKKTACEKQEKQDSFFKTHQDLSREIGWSSDWYCLRGAELSWVRKFTIRHLQIAMMLSVFNRLGSHWAKVRIISCYLDYITYIYKIKLIKIIIVSKAKVLKSHRDVVCTFQEWFCQSKKIVQQEIQINSSTPLRDCYISWRRRHVSLVNLNNSDQQTVSFSTY